MRPRNRPTMPREVIARLMAATTIIAVTTAALMGCGSSKTTSTTPGPTIGTSTSTSTTTTTTPANRNGPFAIGRRDEVFVDLTRKTAANGGLPERPSRTLETIIEYPARGTPDPKVETKNAAPVAGTFPVVLFVHGFSAHADNPYLHYLAAAGFVAVSIKFPLTNTDTPGGPTPTDTFNEPADVKFVLSQLAHLPARDADLEPIIDAGRVGLIGQSLGADVVLDMAYHSNYRDPRVAAVVPMAGGCVGCLQSAGEANGRYYAGPAVPVLFIHGTLDTYFPAPAAQAYAQAPAPKFRLDLIGAHHVQFGPPWEPIAAHATIDFFDHFLKNDAAALHKLNADANVPSTAHLQQTTG